MRRREFIMSLSGAVTLCRAMLLAQQPTKIWRIGFLTPRTRPIAPKQDAFADAFVQGMGALGYREGSNLTIEWRYADGDYTRLGTFAAELVEMNPAVIVSYGTPATRALQKATKTIPIVITAAIDLVGSHFVASLARPGGNLTGLSVLDVDLSGKHLELLKAVVPGLAKVAVLLNPGNPGHTAVLKGVERAAPAFGVEVEMQNADTLKAIVDAFAVVARDQVDAVIIAADGFFSEHGQMIAEAALRNRVATIGVYRDHVTAGTLMSYGPDIAAYHRQAATYVDKILKGAKPEDLPAEEPTKIELVVNLKTANELGLTVPQSLLARADKVIE
jgi:putative tryptophan/tyrosine transport system substrate-binding protein